MALFPSKLHKILTVQEETGQDAIISWLPHGKAFKVHKPEEFESTLMRTHFKQSSFTSFVRQLNLWGFKKITRIGDDQGSYCHPFFERGRPEMCHRMVRQVQSKKGSKMLKHQHQHQYELSMASTTATDDTEINPPESAATRLSHSLSKENPQTSDWNAQSKMALQNDSIAANLLRQSVFAGLPGQSESNMVELLARLRQQQQQQESLAQAQYLLSNASMGAGFSTPASPLTNNNKSLADMVEFLALIELHNQLKHISVPEGRRT